MAVNQVSIAAPSGGNGAPPVPLNASIISYANAASVDDHSTRPFNRPPRILRELPIEEVLLPAAPRLPNQQRARMITILAPLFTVGVYILVAFLRGGGGGGALLILPIVALSLVTAGVSVYNYIDQRRQVQAEKESAEGAFTIALNRAEQRIGDLARSQWETRHANDPSLPESFGLIQGHNIRLWERRPTDNDFLHVRIGIGNHVSSTKVVLEASRETTLYTTRLNDAKDRHSLIKNVPRSVPLPAIGSFSIAGRQAIQAAQAFIWQIVTHHSPDEVRVVAFWPSSHDSHWQWLKSLPHTRSLQGEDSYRLLANSDFDATNPDDKRPEYLAQVMQEIERELVKRREQGGHKHGPCIPYLVILVDNATDLALQGTVAEVENTPLMQALLANGKDVGVSVICLVNDVAQIPSDCGAYLNLSESPQLVATTGHAPQGGTVFIQPDLVENDAQCTQNAEAMLNIPLPESLGSRDMPRKVDLFEMLNIADVATYDPALRWELLPPPDDEHPSGLFPVPIGKIGPNEPMFLDLNEKKEGVHGMIAGTTGSGKSELLTTLLLGLAITHSPQRLHFLLIDFKGGATFGELARLPHTAGFITDLSGSQAERALTAINSELDRRKKYFNDARVKNIKDYRRRSDKEPMPNLIIAIDEFDEMVNDHEDVVDQLIRVAKQGRSLGVHLLFATQQPSNGKIKQGLRTNLTYWIALRVGETDDSKAMLNTKDAALITNATPGRGYKRVGEKAPALFQSAIATLPYTPSSGKNGNDDFLYPDATGRWMTAEEQRQRQTFLKSLTQIGGISHNTQNSYAPTQRLNQLLLPNAIPDINQRTAAEVMIATLQRDPRYVLDAKQRTFAARERPIWEPPLESSVLLSELPPNERDLLKVPIGYVDYPETAQKQVLFLNLPDSGSVLVYGAAGAGKTSVLRTCALALAEYHSPTLLALYLIDAQGWGLGLAADDTGANRLPHIADTSALTDVTKIERLVNVLNDEMQERKSRFQQAGVESWKDYLNISIINRDPLPALVVMIDNLIEFAAVNPEPLREICTMVREGKKYGLHFIFTADRPSSSLPSELKNSIATRIVLRLSSEDDSAVLLNKAFAARVLPQNEGRGYISAIPLPRELQIAYPTLRSPNEVRETLKSLNNADATPQPPATGTEIGTEIDISVLTFKDELAKSVEIIIARRSTTPTLAPRLTLLKEQISVDRQFWLGRGTIQTPTITLATNSRDLKHATIELAKTPHFMIAGGPRSGKSNVLQALLAALICQFPPSELSLYLVDYRARALRSFRDLPHTRFYATDGSMMLPDPKDPAPKPTLMSVLEAELDTARQRDLDHHDQPISKRIIIAVSNVDLLENEATAFGKLSKWVVQGQRLGIHFLVTSNEFGTAGSNSVLKMMRQERCAIVLGNHESTSMNTNLALPPKAIKWPTTLKSVLGRGFLVEGGKERMAQFWHVDDTLLAELPALCQRDPEPPQQEGSMKENV